MYFNEILRNVDRDDDNQMEYTLKQNFYNTSVSWDKDNSII